MINLISKLAHPAFSIPAVMLYGITLVVMSMVTFITPTDASAPVLENTSYFYWFMLPVTIGMGIWFFEWYVSRIILNITDGHKDIRDEFYSMIMGRGTYSIDGEDRFFIITAIIGLTYIGVGVVSLASIWPWMIPYVIGIIAFIALHEGLVWLARAVYRLNHKLQQHKDDPNAHSKQNSE